MTFQMVNLSSDVIDIRFFDQLIFLKYLNHDPKTNAVTEYTFR